MKHELYINDYKVDLSEDIPFPLSFSIADIKDPQNRKRSVSKTITIKGTQLNKRVFSGAYELSLTDENLLGLGFNIDPNARVTARYVKNSREVFNGLCQLMQVNIENGNYTFEIVLFSDFVNLFQQWGDIKVSELDWSEYDHTLNETNLTNSWDTSVIKNGVATSNFTSGDPDGFGYLYPVVDYGYNSSLVTFNINDLVPHVYCKEVLEKAFEYVGRSIDSDFTDSDEFKALMFGFGGGLKNMLPPLDQSSRRVNYSFDDIYTKSIATVPGVSSTSFNAVGGGAINLTNFTETSLNDTYAQYSAGTGVINIQRSGRYRINLDFTVLIDASFSSGTVNTNNSKIRCLISKNGSVIHSTNFVTIPSSATAYDVDIDKELTLQAGDFIKIEFFPIFNASSSASTGVPTYDFTLDLDNDFAFDLTSIEGIYQEGDTINLSRFIPEMKVSEFVKGMITMFNLYIDDTDQDVLKIEPLSEFYLNSSNVDNWSNKLDVSKKQEIKPASVISGKTYNFEFEKDEDTYNKIYFDEFGHYYGNYVYEITNGYTKKGKTFKVPFAQTVPVEISSGYVIPRIVNIDDSTNVVKPFKGKPRIFFYNGLKTATFNINDSTGVNTYTSYPQVHHSYGDIKDLTLDLNFGVPRKVFYTYTNYPLDNLFNNYHRQFIRELTTKDSKIYTAYFKLDDLDIYKGMFRKLVNINGVLFRKNLIMDYDATGYATTKVELLRVLETNDPFTIPPVIGGIIGTSDRTNQVVLSPTGVGQGAEILSGGLNSDLQTQVVVTSYGRI